MSIRDAGIGIPADQLPRVFHMFSQVDRSLEKTQGGLGIGLTLVRRLVETHGGTVEARSEGVGFGSEFVARLPAAEAADAPGAAPEGEPPAARSALRVRIVDDSRDGADSPAAMMRLVGHGPLTASDGEEAVASAAAFRPGVVLLDIGLPRLSGYDASRRIRAAAGAEPPLLVAQTGWGADEDRRRTREAGFDHHLTKPVDPDALLALLAATVVAPGGFPVDAAPARP